MQVRENTDFTRGYFDPDQRSIPNAIEVRFKDGSATPRAEVHFPVGHRRRRQEGIPLLLEKFRHNASTRYSAPKVSQLETSLKSLDNLQELSVTELLDSLAAS
jgi:2-methylcitrate dehydratase